MVSLTMVLMLSTTVVVVLSVVTYTKLSKSMIEETSSVALVENDTVSNSIQIQINEIQNKIPQALIQLNSTKIAIVGLQIKLNEVKMNASQVLLQLDEANRDILNINKTIIKRTTMQIQAEYLQLQLHCGVGEWHHIAHLNMSNTSESCPPVWMEYTSDGVRACKRPISSEGSCPGIVYPINSRQYSKVCGRVIGYQFGSPDGFARGAGTATQFTIDQPYVDGISITHGNPRKHIWSYAAGASEQIGPGSDCSPNTCPCNGGPDSPTYVGNSYYCESAFQGDCFAVNTFFPNDVLWDGQQCHSEGTCCTGANTPPWFKVGLSNPTTDDIEVRICHNQSSTDEDSPIILIELYVQ